MLVVVQGRVIFSYGDVTHTSKVASVRKSVLGMLYGNYVASGKIDLTKTVKQLGLDDNQPFLPSEEHVTLEQLLTSRSGRNSALGRKRCSRRLSSTLCFAYHPFQCLPPVRDPTEY
jgi:CubicO group peptidase (beta-lactamase class C family)